MVWPRSSLLPALLLLLPASGGEGKPEPLAEAAGGALFLRLKPEASLEHREAEGCWIGTGGVVLKRGDTTLSASRIVYWDREEAAYAEGFVVLEGPGRRVFAERGYYEWSRKRGRLEKGRIIRHAEGRGIHYYISAESIDLDGSRTVLNDVTLTTCAFAAPHYAWRAKEMVLTEGEGPDLGQLVSHGNVLQLGDTTVGYLPVWSKDLGKARFPLRTAKAGKESGLGYYLRTEWDLPLPGRPEDLFLHLDAFSKHDPAGGPELQWKRRDEGGDYEGRALLYGTQDSKNAGKTGGEDRWRGYAVDHRFHDGGWSSILEFSKLSDPQFLPLYFEKESRTGKEQETRAYVQRVKGDYAGSLLLKDRLNSFQDQVEYLPKADFRVLSKSFLNGRLLWNSTTEAASVEHRRDDELPAGPNDQVDRLDTFHEGIVPFPLGPLHGQLFADERLTFFSARKEDNGNETRLVSGAGARVGTQFLKPLATTSEFWNIRAMRHIVVPQVEYRNAYDATVPARDLQQIDAVDAQDRLERFTFSLDNLWQAKRRPARRQETDQPEAEPPPLVTSDFATLGLRMHYYPEPRRDNDDHPWSPLEGRFRILPRDYLAAYTDWTYNPEVSDGLETWNIGMTINPDYAEAFGGDRFGRSRFSARALESDRSGARAAGGLSDRWSLNVENRYVKNDSSTTNATLTYQFSPRWSAGITQEYDWKLERRGDRRLTFRRDLHEWNLDFSIEKDQTHGNSVFFLVYPKGLF